MSPTPLTHSELSLSEVLSLVHARAEGLCDVVVPLAEVRLTAAGTVDVPRLGERALNEHSRKQLATLLGLNWRRWHTLTTPAERSEEAARRFARKGGSVRLRIGGDGTLRALLPASFRPIEERRVFELLYRTARGLFDEARFVRVAFGAEVSHFTAARVASALVGDVALRPGWHLAMSETGAGALSVDDAWTDLGTSRWSGAAPTTLLCALDGKRTFYRTHRPITDEQLAAALTVALGWAEERWTREMARFNAACLAPVPHPGAAVEALLAESPDVPKASLDAALARLGQPVDGAHAPTTRMGVARAVAQAAPEENPAARFAMERRAGDYALAGGAS